MKAQKKRAKFYLKSEKFLTMADEFQIKSDKNQLDATFLMGEGVKLMLMKRGPDVATAGRRLHDHGEKLQREANIYKAEADKFRKRGNKFKTKGDRIYVCTQFKM